MSDFTHFGKLNWVAITLLTAYPNFRLDVVGVWLMEKLSGARTDPWARPLFSVHFLLFSLLLYMTNSLTLSISSYKDMKVLHGITFSRLYRNPCLHTVSSADKSSNETPAVFSHSSNPNVVNAKTRSQQLLFSRKPAGRLAASHRWHILFDCTKDVRAIFS